jgi:hypothetical protein
MPNGALRVGKVMRVSSQGFVVGCRVMQEDVPTFGSFVRAEGRTPGGAIYGLIYDVTVEDDLMVRRVVMAESPDEEAVRDQPVNRQIPIEVSVLTVGRREGDRIIHCIPPQPPVTMNVLYRCSPDEVVGFTQRLDYFRLVLNRPEVPADELLAASLRAAAEMRPEQEREGFLVAAGRELARLLAGDLLRLDGLLRSLREGLG